VRALQGTGASKINPGSGAPSSRLIFAILAATLTALALTATPAFAAEASCAGLPEPERAHEEQLRAENNSLQLPDCRAYELVSPSEKTGGRGAVLAFEYGDQLRYPMQSTADGNAITYTGEPFFQATFGGLSQYTSVRDPDGWSTVNVSPAALENGDHARMIEASEDLSKYLLVSLGLQGFTTEAPAAYRNLDLLGSEGSIMPLITRKPPNQEPEQFGNSVGGGHIEELYNVASSEDMSRVFFAANDALTENAVDGGKDENNLYRWTAGQLHLVNVLPDGVSEPNATLGFEYSRVEPAEELEKTVVPDLEHAVSDDGLRVFWTDNNDGNLYLRESYVENGEEREQTVLVGEGADFLTASDTGNKVFFTKDEELYEYDVESGLTVDLTASSSARLQGVLGASQDGEYVYLVAAGALAAGAVQRPCEPLKKEEEQESPKELEEEGRGELPGDRGCNLYLYHAGKMVFVTALSAKDNLPSSIVQEGVLSDSSNADWARTGGVRTAEVSPNGLFVAFGSQMALTGQSEGESEIFVYNAATGALACASCSSSGGGEGSYLPPQEDSYGTHRQRYMLDDGRLFFTTKAALVPQDTNGQEDVYEWEGGAVHLISSGTSGSASVFADASEDGNNVFFTTSQALVPEDGDEITDLYDAREDGGFPVPTGLASSCTTSEACQGASSQPPGAGAPVSATFSGGGNVIQSPSTAAGAARRALTRAQKLARSLRACRGRTRKRRVVCESQARRRYGSKARGRAKKGGR
jgi:hypothetical protein